MLQQIVDQVTFTRFCAPYRMGETAGFPSEKAEEYVKAGAGKITRRGVPQVSPAVSASDVAHQIEAMTARLNSAERDARKASKTPEGAADAQTALRDIAETRKVLASLEAKLAAGPDLLAGSESREPGAAAGGH
jgi:hypothetical protein